jgi:SOS-response transcriptional repressor LexA
MGNIFMKYGITKKQLKLFNFLKDYIKKNITSPSYDEMMVALGLNSKCTISAKLKQLEERGWIEKMNGKNRSIRVTGK